jgi:SNF2 family DNA or RNA helicase
MPRIFDNITLKLNDALREITHDAVAASFCVGYLSLRGWDALADLIDHLEGGSPQRACRVLVGMHRPPEEEMKLLAYPRSPETLDGNKQRQALQTILTGFKTQLEFGVPTRQAEQSLRRLAQQLRRKKVFIKTYLRAPLHAKLYLIERTDNVTPRIGFVGSSNLTLSGLYHQGELNVDVVEQDAANKLQDWFEERWNDPLAWDISDELAHLIETSWARTDPVRPYLVYLKIAHHLSRDARESKNEYPMPKEFGGKLYDFQEAAIALATRYLYKRRGVLLGDVVGLGKTRMATAIAKILEKDLEFRTLIICPPKLQDLWSWHVQEFKLFAKIMSLGDTPKKLKDLRRHHLLILDESHNLRNRGKRYQAIQEYIQQNDCRVLLLSATPFNKHYTDLSNQLRLFLNEDEPLPVRPERLLREWARNGKDERRFYSETGAQPNTLKAFECSPYPEDWRDLMRLYLVRRTRKFILDNYGEKDERTGRRYISMHKKKYFFPERKPIRLTFPLSEKDPHDQYARFFSDDVIAVIEDLTLPRYGLSKYLVTDAPQKADAHQREILANLNRAGQRLIGFCRTNFYKRLESSGHSFTRSLERHLIRNLAVLHALESKLEVPIGIQDPALLDSVLNDTEQEYVTEGDDSADQENLAAAEETLPLTPNFEQFKRNAEKLYARYQNPESPEYHRVDWLPHDFFTPALATALYEDAQSVYHILKKIGRWRPEKDAKLHELINLIQHQHPEDKLLIFTQFADTANYLADQLKTKGITDCAVVTSATPDPVTIAKRFSPRSNGVHQPHGAEIRILIATDVLAEGQNLQDCHIVVNYDLPWAIIRLIQRVGRVDRIGQTYPEILSYSFFPAEGVERIIRLRTRLLERLKQNQEIIGTDESLLGEDIKTTLTDLYTEKAGVLDDDSEDSDIDLASEALQAWNKASPQDQKAAIELPNIVYATRPALTTHDPNNPPGVITYIQYGNLEDVLVRVNTRGEVVSQSLSAIFRAAACDPNTPAHPPLPNHHELVQQCVKAIQNELQGDAPFTGVLGNRRSTRRKVYERLEKYKQEIQKRPLLTMEETLQKVDALINLIWQYRLTEDADQTLKRHIRAGISDEYLLQILIQRMEDNTLCSIPKTTQPTFDEPQIICSLGLAPQE